MILPALICSLLLQDQAFVSLEIPSAFGGREDKLFMLLPEQRLRTPKLSPKTFGEDKIRFEFDWLTPAYAWTSEDRAPLRFRVYSQEHREEGDLAPQVAQTLLRLFDYNFEKLKLDHNESVNSGIVDVYLCWGGTPGGEQLLDQEMVGSRAVKVNTIYIYDLGSFTDPVERLREVAHEYGHAVLPAVGGFREPEEWANGYLGEKIYLAHLREGMAQGLYTPRDTMGATLPQLDAWVKKHVEPLVTAAAATVPDPSVLSGTGQKAMDAYNGLAAYMAALLPGKTFVRSMKLGGSMKAADYPSGIALAMQEGSVRLTVPPYLKGKTIWIPVSDGSVSGTPVLQRKGGWVQIKPGNGPVTVVPKSR